MDEAQKREKVINGVECCNALHNGGTVMCGTECPYGIADGIDRGCRYKLIPDALAMLKAQEPVEPVPGLWYRDIQLYKCGACGGEIGAGGIAKYCFHCGQAVKWE